MLDNLLVQSSTLNKMDQGTEPFWKLHELAREKCQENNT